MSQSTFVRRETTGIAKVTYNVQRLTCGSKCEGKAVHQVVYLALVPEELSMLVENVSNQRQREIKDTHQCH